MTRETVTHAQLLEEIEAVKDRLTRVETAVAPLSKVVTAMGGEEAFAANAIEALDGLRTLRTIGKWVKGGAALIAAIALILTSAKFMIVDLWQTTDIPPAGR